MASGEYNPLVAAQVGHRHGHPFQREGGGQDGAPALSQFVHESMGGYTEPERSELLAALKDDGVRNLEQLVRLKEEELTGLANCMGSSQRAPVPRAR